jgi:hypothetical protein
LRQARQRLNRLAAIERRKEAGFVLTSSACFAPAGPPFVPRISCPVAVLPVLFCGTLLWSKMARSCSARSRYSMNCCAAASR